MQIMGDNAVNSGKLLPAMQKDNPEPSRSNAEGATIIPERGVGPKRDRSAAGPMISVHDMIWTGGRPSAVPQGTARNQRLRVNISDEYFGIAWPTTWRPMKNNLEGVYQYRDEGFQMIYNGEIGKYEGMRFIEQTNVPHGNYNSGNYVMTSSFTPWVNVLSDWAFFFGEDTVAEALVVPEEVRGKIPTDYGRAKGIAWYYLGQTIGPFAGRPANENFVNSGNIRVA